MNPQLFPDPVSAFGALALLGLVPFLALVTTSFTKISIVLLLTRNALGLREAPPTMVVNGFAIILSDYIMAPIGQQAWRALQEQGPREGGPAAESLLKLAGAARGPLTDFMARNTSARETRFFAKTARDLWPKEMADTVTERDLLVLIPSFTVTELTAAFQIGFVVYLVFLVIDLLASGVLLALNMHMMSPTVVSIPLKILLFVALDGWTTLIHNLVLTYR
jgi:type III secretion protein R